jgi:hypothetical protein
LPFARNCNLNHTLTQLKCRKEGTERGLTFSEFGSIAAPAPEDGVCILRKTASQTRAKPKSCIPQKGSGSKPKKKPKTQEAETESRNFRHNKSRNLNFQRKPTTKTEKNRTKIKNW